MFRGFLPLWVVATALTPVFGQVIEPFHAGEMAPMRATFKGRPVLFHVWSLTCAPCLAEMPKWAQRIRQHPEVAFIFMNADGVSQSAAAAQRLAIAGVKPSRSLIYADDYVERLQNEIAPEWHGELPRTEWTAVNGKKFVVLGPVTDAQFGQWALGKIR